MTSNKQMARTSGICYLLLIITGMYSLMYVPSQLIVWDDPALMLSNITNSLLLYKSGVAVGLLSTLTYLALALLLYRLLQQVHKQYAIVMVILVLACVPFTFSFSLHQFAVVSLIESATAATDTSVLQEQVYAHLKQYSRGIMVAQIFWGLWLAPFGYLVYKSGFLPKFFGIFLMLGCVGYVLTFLGDFFIEDYSDTLFSTIAGIPASVGELGICLWFLIVGAKNATKQDLIA